MERRDYDRKCTNPVVSFYPSLGAPRGRRHVDTWSGVVTRGPGQVIISGEGTGDRG